MNQKTKEYREQIAQKFIQALEEQQGKWEKNWLGVGTGIPENAVTGRKYRGLNRFYLALMGNAMRSEDPRWATFKQIQDKKWHLNKGAKGVKVEYWQPYDFAKKNYLTWEEYFVRNNEKDVGVIAKYFVVFNAKDITGIPERQKIENKDVVSDELIKKISNGMGVVIYNDGGDSAYYRGSTDSIHLPVPEAFFSSYDYNATALHELSHATGTRLGRDMGGFFGSKPYAYEELVAEISASFMAEHLEIAVTDSHIENHKAYVQSWIQGLKEDPEALIKAIRDAGKAADYLEYHGGLISLQEYQKLQHESIEIPGENHLQKEMAAQLTGQGYAPTQELLERVRNFNQITKKEHTLQEIHQAYRARTYAEESAEGKLLFGIVHILKKQEMDKLLLAQMPVMEP